jgi:transposase
MVILPCCCGLCDTDAILRETHGRWRAVLSQLNEHQARLFAADRALEVGSDGPRIVSRVTGLSSRTIERGIRELRSGVLALGPDRSRRRGGGRKPREEADPALPKALEALLEQTTAGDPMGLLKWTSQSLRGLAEELTKQGHTVSHPTIGRILHELGYSLKGNVKTLEGEQHPDRDAQFRYIHERAKEFVRAQQPAISVDTKKKEKVGEFDNAGQRWRRGERRVNVYDFPSLAEGVAIPYGVYDEEQNEGLVNVGVSHDTAEFAVASIQQWWDCLGRDHYPQATEILITADGGGSNRSRVRLWKVCLQRFADRTGLDVTVCHYPPGTSKWNKVEHRLFSYISMNWRGQPLTTYTTVVELVGHTTTKAGLHVTAKLDTRQYATKIKVPDKEIEQVQLERHAFHPDWNYTIRHQA